MKKLTLISSAVALVLSCTVAAKITPEQAARLGNDLTPMGAEKAGNADGSIPAWDGGITAAPAGYSAGMHHIDPFADDKVLFTIDKSNLDQYQSSLSPGQVKLFDIYPDTYKMNVYQTRRTASYPQYVYDATKNIATKAELIEGGNGIVNAAIGIPFPIPDNGLEAVWNHLLRFRGVAASRNGGQAAPTSNGAYTIIGFEEQIMFKYSEPNASAEALTAENILFRFKQGVTSPARLAGTALLVHETMDQVKTPRQAWTYNTGQRRVRRAPNVAYDAPGTASDGLRTTDDFDMFNGSPDRYNWNLVGKQELYIPYNSYKMHSNEVKYDSLLMSGHINPEYVRWEKHRVWVVEATLKDNTRHVYGKRVFYIDEDSWQIHVADLYDNRNELYRVAVAHGLNYYEVPTHWSTLEVYHDLNSRRYIAIGLDNEDKMYNFSVELTDADFTPAALRREGTR
uniref:Outer membrane lipoprotein-sorting protein n=1 Tax=Rheinheimera sp. BAL341 TaxID=1708203 RepID=A0A486XK59_9GAMM